MIQDTPEHLLVQAESSPNIRSLAWIEDLMLSSGSLEVGHLPKGLSWAEDQEQVSRSKERKKYESQINQASFKIATILLIDSSRNNPFVACIGDSRAREAQDQG